MTDLKLSNAVFFSDLHLSERRFPEHEHVFVEILRKLRGEGVQELVLLGDIFDFMVGPYQFWLNRHSDFFSEIDQWIKESRTVLWIEGNHDFHLSKLLSPKGVIVIEDFVVIPSSRGDCYLAHGDLVNQSNAEYLQWRQRSRSRTFKGLIESLPEFIAERAGLWLGNRLSQKSRQQGRTQNSDHREEISKLFRGFARNQWGKGVYGVFLGHSHVEDLVPNSQQGFYLNLGSWLDGSAHYALWNPAEYNHPRVITRKI